MAEQAQLELVIEAQADRVLAGLASFEGALGRIEGAHAKAQHAADQHSQAVDSLALQLEKASSVGEFFKRGLEGTLALLGAGALTSGLEGLIAKTTTYDTTVSHLTQTLAGNAEAASTWAVIADHLGVDGETLTRSFAKLGGEVNNNSEKLREMGIATQDGSGHLRDLNSVLIQAADYFHAHAGEANNAYLAQELFGRSGVALLPILQQGSGAIAQITDEARKYGLILDSETVQKNRQFQAELDQAKLAAEGLAVSIGNALLPGLAYLTQGLANIVEKNLPAFIAGIDRAVSYVIGFFEGLTGLNAAADEGAVKMTAFQNVSGSTGTQLDTAAGSAANMAAAERQVRDNAKEATDALDAQVRTLDDQQKAFEKTINDQIKSLQGQGSKENFDTQQTKLKQQESEKQKEIERLKADEVLDIYLGQFDQAAQIDRQITTDKQDVANIEKELAKGSADYARQQQIDSLKSQLDAKKEETDKAKQLLEDQKKSIQDAAQKQIEAMQDAATKSHDALIGGAAGVGDAFGAAGTDAGIKFAKDLNAESVGKKAGDDLRESFQSGDWSAVGDRIGTAVGNALITTMGSEIERKAKSTKIGPFSIFDLWNASVFIDTHNPFVLGNLGNDLQWVTNTFGTAAIPNFDSGGIVPGAVGQPQLVVAHGGERVQTPAQQQSDGGDDRVVELLGQLIAAVYETAPQSATLADLAAATSAAQAQRMRGVMTAGGV